MWLIFNPTFNDYFTLFFAVFNGKINDFLISFLAFKSASLHTNYIWFDLLDCICEWILSGDLKIVKWNYDEMTLRPSRRFLISWFPFKDNFSSTWQLLQSALYRKCCKRDTMLRLFLIQQISTLIFFFN